MDPLGGRGGHTVAKGVKRCLTVSSASDDTVRLESKLRNDVA